MFFKLSLLLQSLMFMTLATKSSILFANECRDEFGLVDPQEMFSDRALRGELRLPGSTLPDFVKTGAGGGYATLVPDDSFTHEYIGFSLSGRAPGPAMDIGCSYGIADRQILKCGQLVIAVDHSLGDLEVFYSETLGKGRENLELHRGFFPDYPRINSNTLGSILISRVFHFMDPETIQASFRKAFALLAPGGKLFVTTETAFHQKALKSGFLDTYLKRVASANPWPGILEDARSVYGPAYDLPLYMNFMNEEVLNREAELAGFVVERVHTIPRPNFPIEVRLDGRESVGMVARKPNF